MRITKKDEPSQDKSLGELFSELASETSTLVRQEVQLAKTEMMGQVTAGVQGAAFLVAAGSLAFVGFQALVAAAILALSLVLAPWLAALLIGLALLAIGGVMVPIALSRLKKLGQPPRQTIETLKEDAQWMKEQTK